MRIDLLDKFEKISILKNLSNMDGVSGDEFKISIYLKNVLKKYTDDIEVDNMGNITACLKKAEAGYLNILLDAHIDQVGMIVTSITEEGFLRVSNIGGLDRKILLSQNVLVHTNRGSLIGTVSSKPPHLLEAKEYDKIPDISDIFIDIGFSKEEAGKFLSIGDRVTFDIEFGELFDGHIFGSALDDRAGVVAILSTLDEICLKNLKCGLSVLFSVQEEVGLRGATTSGFAINPDIAIGVDVTFGSNSEPIEEKCGKVGGGPMVGVAPTLDKSISSEFIEIAKNSEIPHQIEVMNGKTGTNCDAFGLIKSGIRTGLLSIPLKYMHTPVEMVKIDDIENLSQLLKLYIEKKGE